MVSSKKTISTEMVFTSGSMDRLMTDILNAVKNVALVNITSKMAIFTKVNIKTTKETAKVYINGKKDQHFKASSKTTISN